MKMLLVCQESLLKREQAEKMERLYELQQIEDKLFNDMYKSPQHFHSWECCTLEIFALRRRLQEIHNVLETKEIAEGFRGVAI